MEAVIFDGKEYLKASVLAAKFRYTQDYLGQLCRAKKVDARLVGRAWYINLASLESHRASKYQSAEKTKSSEISPKKSSNNYLSRIDVEPVLKNKTVKIFKEKDGKLTEVPVRYELDDYSLIPKINKAAISAELHVLPADAENLRIKKEAKKFTITDFKAEPLPEVSLKGSIRIEGIPEATEESQEQLPEVSDIASKIKPEQKVEKRVISVRFPKNRLKQGVSVDIKPQQKNLSKTGATSEPQQSQNLETPTVRRVTVHKKLSERPRPHKNPLPGDISPKAEMIHVASKAIKFTPDVVASQKVQRADSTAEDGLGAWKFFAIIASALVVAFALLLTKSELTVGKGTYSESLSFDESFLRTVLQHF